jgi:hypothetical protein
MTHLRESLLIALRDGALDPTAETAARSHLTACSSCSEDLATLEERSSDVAAALEALDVFFDEASARASVRVRVARAVADTGGAQAVAADGGRAAGSHRASSAPRRSRAYWLRAAGVVLFLASASAAAALPGSPLRRWVGDLMERSASGAATADHPTPAALPTEEATGVRISVSGGALQVLLRGVPAGGDIEVHWVPGSEAAVFGPVGSRFTSAAGRIEATLNPGRVRVELPRGVVPTTLVVNDHTYLSRTLGGLEVPGPVIRQDDSIIVFRAGAR